MTKKAGHPISSTSLFLVLFGKTQAEFLVITSSIVMDHSEKRSTEHETKTNLVKSGQSFKTVGLFVLKVTLNKSFEFYQGQNVEHIRKFTYQTNYA